MHGRVPRRRQDDRLESRPWVEFDGSRPRAEIPRLLRASRVAIVASKARKRWAEQFGFALVEAMACGLPVVATRSGAIPEVVAAWNPLAPEGDLEALADGLRAALGPQGATCGARNLQFVQRHYELHQQGAAMRAAIEPVIARHHLAA
jgi:glycosyltransferase involved in cell wall biosynthesis